MSIVTIIGAGMMGTALCWPLSDNGHKIHLVGTHLDEDYIRRVRRDGIHPKMERSVPANVIPYSHTQIAEAVEGADVIVGGISSFGLEWFAEKVGPHMKPGVPVLTITKGLADMPNGDLKIIPDYLDSLLPADKQGKISLNAAGGPVISHEVAARRPTGTVFCGRETHTLEDLRQIFGTDTYRVNLSLDMIGVEVCAALKNAFAVAVNLPIGLYEKVGPDGLGRMVNPQAALFAQSLIEMQRLLILLGGNPQEVIGLPGAGDLYVTVFAGRTAQLGKMLGQGISFSAARRALAGETLESVEIITRVNRALPKLEARGLVKSTDFPLLKHLNAMINAGAPPILPWKAFFEDHLA